MRAAVWTLPFVLFGCAAATGASDESPPPSTSESATAGFATWLAERCPDGARVAIKRADSEEVISAISCEDARSKVLADDLLRDELVRAYLAETESRAAEAGERLGEAREPLTPLGLLCFLASGAAGLAGTFACERHPNDPTCGRGVAWGGIGFGMLCLLF
jgi:hypothetical protein